MSSGKIEVDQRYAWQNTAIDALDLRASYLWDRLTPQLLDQVLIAFLC